MEDWCLGHLLTLALLATSQAWVLQTTDTQVILGSTHDVELICRQGNTPEDTDKINTISEIRITKQGPFSSKLTFVQIDTHKQSAKEEGVTVTGEINQDGGSFLRVKWLVANDKTPGAYGCEIDVIDSDNKFVCLHAKPILIQEKFLTVDDVNKLISSVTSGYERKQQALELEIAQLKTFIDHELNKKGQKIKDVKETLASEISILNENVKVKYATKAEVSLQMSEVHNFILHENMSERNHSSCQHTYGELNSTMYYLKKNIFEKIDSVETNIKFIGVQVDNRNDYFTEQVERIHSKVELCCPNLFSTTHTERPTAGVSIPTPATLSSASRNILNQWPSGKYTMIKPRIGCPVSDEGKLIFYTLPYTLESPVDNIHSLFKVNLRSGYRMTKLQFCCKSTDSSSLIRWPKGSYCIGKSYSTCPEGFSKGEMKQRIMLETIIGEKQPIGIYKGGYCCRSDGNANVPVTLPTRDPFYLYRYNGKCQEVKGMDVEKDYIFMWKEIHVSTALTSKWTSPDVDSNGNVILCHYLNANK